MTTLTHLDFADALRGEVGQLSALFASADESAVVPSCPGWQVRDLVGHLGSVHRWVTEIVRTGESAQPIEAPADADLGQWYADSADALVRTLAAADPARSCWTLASPHEVGFWSRRQVHETMVHRWDLANAVGARVDLSPALATDGIDEAITMFFPRQIRLGRQAPLTDAVAIVETGSGRRWVLEGDGAATDHDSATVDATVTGDAVQLLLLLWQRADLADSPVQVVGDAGAAGRLFRARLTP